MNAMAKSSRRILIGAGSYADAKSAFRLVERLAGELVTELGGLLVEETLLTEITGLPKQRVITSSGSMIVAPSRKQIRTLVRSDERAFRETLSTLAHSRKWSFERQRGDLISGLCEAAKDWDLLLLGHRVALRLTGCVVLVAPATDATTDAERLAGEMANALGTGSVVLTLDPHGPPTDAEHREGEHFENERALLERIARIHASAVVLDLATGPLRTYEQLRHLLAAARCPIVVLGAGQGERSKQAS